MNGQDSDELTELRQELTRLRAENGRLRSLLGLDNPGRVAETPSPRPTLFPDDNRQGLPKVDRASPSGMKIALFRELFVGRDDVYAVRWKNSRTGRAGWSPAVVGGWRNARAPHRQYLALSSDVLNEHLVGNIHAGLYPLLRDDSCRLLACDFDGPTWALDALAFFDAAKAAGISVALERSRSGDGAHVWTFFSGPVPASTARRVGMHVIREAMTLRAELDLASYDRLFPAQDYLPRGSFGNLIALPLQGACRKEGTTVFLNPATLEPYDDQWAFLSNVPRMSPETVSSLALSIPPIAAGPDDFAYRSGAYPGDSKPPRTIRATSGPMLAIERSGIPAPLMSALKHLASLHNPAYYEKERLRFSTWNTPRFLRCYRETLEHLLLPRGVRGQAEQIVADAGSRLVVTSASGSLSTLDLSLRATLSKQQREAADALIDHPLGVLVAPPGAGKTVIACAVIAEHRLPTLIIVDRQPLIDQWRDRLVEHLGINRKGIGQVGAGRRRATGVIDIGMIQSLAKRDDLADLTRRYGLVVVDECHHVPAVTFERCVREIPVERWLGLTATPYRRDGLQGLISMYCGPIRHRMTRTSESARLKLELFVHPTEHVPLEIGASQIQDVFRAIVSDEHRTAQIAGDVARAVEAGRNCLVLSQWTGHLEGLAGRLRVRGHEPLILKGGIAKKARSDVMLRLQHPQPGRGSLLLATGSFLGEGFDHPPLDTLFLAFPLAFKGRIVQYVGRVLRETVSKSSVQVHDYVDVSVPVLARMHAKRLHAYAALGFDVGEAEADRRRRRFATSASRISM